MVWVRKTTLPFPIHITPSVGGRWVSIYCLLNPNNEDYMIEGSSSLPSIICEFYAKTIHDEKSKFQPIFFSSSIVLIIGIIYCKALHT